MSDNGTYMFSVTVIPKLLEHIYIYIYRMRKIQVRYISHAQCTGTGNTGVEEIQFQTVSDSLE